MFNPAGLFGNAKDEESEVSRLSVALYISGGFGAVVLSTVIIALIPSVPSILYVAPGGAVALTLFLVYLFAREYFEAAAERRALEDSSPTDRLVGQMLAAPPSSND